MIRTVLVDDEIDSIRVLKRMLNTYCPEIDIVGEAESVDKALQVIQGSLPDLLLLDIAINDENAFDLLGHLNPDTFQVIFVTAWNTHAVQAFKYSAVDYLLKPVDGDDLRKAVDKVAKRSQEKGVVQKLQVLMDNISALQLTQQKIAIPTMNGLSFIFLKDILRLEAKGSCTAIYLDGGEQIVTTRTIRGYENLLPETVFYRVHNSHIINLNKVRKYQKGRGGYLTMEDGTTVEVALRRKEDFLRLLLK